MPSRQHLADLIWIAISGAIPRFAIVSAVFGAAFLLTSYEYGLIGTALVASIFSTQTFGYSGALFYVKHFGSATLTRVVFFRALQRILVLGTLSGVLTFVILLPFREQGVVFFLFFSSYALLSTISQCLVGMLQGRGRFEGSARLLSTPLISGALAAIALAAKFGVTGFAAGLCLAYAWSVIRSYRLLLTEVTQADPNLVSENTPVRPSSKSEIFAIALAGLTLGAAGLLVVKRIEADVGFAEVGIFFFALQLRSVLFFIPGVFSVHFTSSLARGNEIDKRQTDPYLAASLRASVLCSGLVLGVAIFCIIGLIIIGSHIPLPMMQLDVLLVSAASSLVVAFGTPFFRLTALRSGEWSATSASAAASFTIVLLSQSLPASAFWQSTAFLGGYVIQLFVALLITLRHMVWKGVAK